MATASYKTIKTLKATAGQSVFNFALDYLRKPFIQMSINGAAKTYSTDYSISGQELTYPAGCAEGDTVVIKRITSTDRIVTWSDASVLRASDLTVFETQLLHIQEELSDAVQTDAADQALAASVSAAEAAASLATLTASLTNAVTTATNMAANSAVEAANSAVEAANSAVEAANSATSIGTITPTASSIPKSLSTGKLDVGWLGGLLVEEKIITEATTAITFSDLTGVAHGGYVLVAEVVNTSGSTVLYGLGVNGDTTPTNYSRQILLSQGSITTAQQQASSFSNSIVDLPTGNVCYSTTEIIANPSIGVYMSKTFQGRSDGPLQLSNSVKVLTDDITSLTITATVSNGICPGTKFTLYRRK